MASSTPGGDAGPKKKKQSAGVKEILTSLTIAFAMAFIFRGFVMEGFVIPTGSMAPTLMGEHTRWTSPESGYEWPVGPWQMRGGVAASPQRVDLHDPMTGTSVAGSARPAIGDRLFVLKYLRGVYEPARWDVPVFKYPRSPHGGGGGNYIKRLVGMPNEQLVLIDGDVFYRPVNAVFDEAAGRWGPGDPQKTADGWAALMEDGWRVARKSESERVQRSLWQLVFDSRYTPEGVLSFRPRWEGEGRWAGLNTREYRLESERGELVWNERVPIDDYYPYNEREPGAGGMPWARPTTGSNRTVFPVSDLSMALSIVPEVAPVGLTARLEARGMVYEGVIERQSGRVVLRYRRDTEGEWTEGAAARISPLEPGDARRIEFWHVDQELVLWVDGDRVASCEIDLSPVERLELATGESFTDLAARSKPGSSNPYERRPLAEPSIYRAPRLRWVFDGGDFTLHRVSVHRDIYYRGDIDTQAKWAVGPDNIITLGPDHFFMTGDNSPSSFDSRYWGSYSDGDGASRRFNDIDPWVYTQIDPTPGPVHRKLLVGRAFVVYFPAPLRSGPLPMFDFGRMRWVW